MKTEEKKEFKEEETPMPLEEESKIITTEEEMESFFIVKSILRSTVDIQRVAYRDTQSYFGILLDDNNRKPICRLYFNSQSKKYLATFDKDRKEIKHEISSLDDIYKYQDDIRAIISLYDTK